MAVARGDASGVCVAIRVRPFVAFEEARGDQNVVAVVEGEPRIAISASDYRTFDHVFRQNDPQEAVFSSAVTSLIDGIFDGYNATILAYGQTGSGKTYTMGTAIDLKNKLTEEQLGIIPRSVLRIYDMIEEAKCKAAEQNFMPPQFVIHVQFVEIYMDDIRDLLDESKAKSIFVLEQENSIVMKGAKLLEVSSAEQLMEALGKGSKRRTVGSTKMNDQSSRSHAIFSIHLKITRSKVMSEVGDGDVPVDTETVRTKFHFVDLAGSECMDQTGAEGQTAKEGIDINMGLFHLGQVINALTSKRSFIPYRSCKLTRLLQDSLGGNSRTLMIACISPSSANERHSLGTLNYASNAKKIQNLVSKNVTSSASQEAYLRTKINDLEAKLLLYESGRMVCNPAGNVAQSDLYKENLALTKERDALKLKVESLSALLDEKQTQIISMAYRDVDAAAILRRNNAENNQDEDPVAELAKKYIEQNQKLRDELVESRKETELLVRQKEHLQACLANKYEVPDVADDEQSTLPPEMKNVISDIIRRRKMLRRVTAKEEEVQLDVTQEFDDEYHADEEVAIEDEEEEIPDTEVSMAEQEMDEIVIEAHKENQKDLSQLVQVNADINVYEKVIEKLVEDLNRQKIAEKMYDEKCRALSEQITHAEKERDTLMNSMKNDKKSTNDKKELDRRLKEVSEKYEARIRELKREESRVRSLENSLKISDKKREQTEAELKRNQERLSNLQKTKDDLKRKMEQDNKKYQEQIKSATKQIRDLKSDLNKRDIDMNKLKNKDQKRIDELNRELERLRSKQQQFIKVPERKPLVARKTAGILNRSKCEAYLQKLITLIMEKASRAVILGKRKQDMDALVQQRTEKQQELISLKKRLRATRFTSNVSMELQSQLEALQSDIDHLTKSINDHGAQLEDVKNESTAEIIDQCKTLAATKYLAYGLADHCYELQCQTVRASQDIKDAKAEIMKIKELKETDDLFNMLVLEKVEKPVPLLDDVENDADAASVKSNEKDKERRKTKGPDELLYGGAKGNFSRHSRIVSSPEPLRELNKNGSAEASSMGNSHTSDSLLDDPVTFVPSIDQKVINFKYDISNHNCEVTSMDATGLLVASGSRDRGCNISDIVTRDLLVQLGPHENIVRAVKFIPNTTCVVTASCYYLRVYDLRSPRQIVNQFQSSGIGCNPSFSKMRVDEATVPPSEFIINCFDLDASGYYLFASCGNEAIRCFDIRNRTTVCKIDLPVSNSPLIPGTNRIAHMNSLCVSHLEDSSGDLQIVAAHNNSQTISVVRYTPGIGVRDVVPLNLRTGSATSAVCVGDNIFTATANGRLTRYVGQKRDISIPNAHTSPIMCMKLVDTSNETLLATGCSGGIVNFWRFQGSQGLTRVSTGCKTKGQILTMASTDRNFLVSSSDMKGFFVYDIDSKDI